MSRPLARLSLTFVLAAAFAACTVDSATAPTTHTDVLLNTSTGQEQMLIGADAEFARIAREAPGFGGMFYDANGRLNIYMKSATQRSAAASQLVLDKVDAVLTALGGPMPGAQSAIIREGTRDYVELTTLHAAMSPILGEAGVVFTDIEETQNKLVVGMVAGTSDMTIHAALQQLNVPGDAVSLETTPAIVPLSGHTLQDYQSPFAGGLQIASETPDFAFLCTLGFNVLRGETERNQKYFFTNSQTAQWTRLW